MTYFNTVPETDRLEEYQEKAEKQDTRILDFFQQHPGRKFTPPDVHRFVMPEAPLTSVRRAITDLTGRGLLVKCNDLMPGIYGRDNNTWMLPANGKQLDMFA